MISHPLSHSKQPSVLIVDDEPSMCELIGLLLEGFGYRIAGTASNGTEAIETARKLRPDIIILDYAMPLMNGIKAAQHILAEREVPIIMCSGCSSDEIQAEARRCGIRAFVPKPFTSKQWEQVLQLTGLAPSNALTSSGEVCASAA